MNRSGWTYMADAIVIGSTMKIVAVLTTLIVSGALSETLSFEGGACIIASVLFADFYFRDEGDAVL